jgi:hypothetical protein
MKYMEQSITEIVTNALNPDGVTDWDEDETYNKDDIVVYDNHYWMSYVDDNTTKPDSSENINWVRYVYPETGSTSSNPYSCIDLESGSKTIFVGDDLYIDFKTTVFMEYLAIGYYEADTVTVEIYTGTYGDGHTVIWEYETESTINENVTDYFTYIYSDYGTLTDRGVLVKLGYMSNDARCRVTFNKSAEQDRTACGFLVGGELVDMGKTLNQVTFNFNSNVTDAKKAQKTQIQDLVDFQTMIKNEFFSETRRKIKQIYKEIVVFVVDEDESSKWENLITLGVIQDSSIILTDDSMTTISWSVAESI